MGFNFDLNVECFIKGSVKNKSYGYFKWYDEPMNERNRDVINDLKEENKRLVAKNWNLGNSGRCNFECEVAELWVELNKA